MPSGMIPLTPVPAKGLPLDGAFGIGTVTRSGGEVTGGPVGGVPLEVAVLMTSPATTSARVNR